MNRSKRRSVAFRPCIQGIERLESLRLLSGGPPPGGISDIDESSAIFADPFFDGDPDDAPLINYDDLDSTIGFMEGEVSPYLSQTSTGSEQAPDKQQIIDDLNAQRNNLLATCEKNLTLSNILLVKFKSSSAALVTKMKAQGDAYNAMSPADQNGAAGQRCMQLIAEYGRGEKIYDQGALALQVVANMIVSQKAAINSAFDQAIASIKQVNIAPDPEEQEDFVSESDNFDF